MSVGAVTTNLYNVLIDDFDGQAGNVILAPNSSNVWIGYKWNGSSFMPTATNLSLVANAYYASADVDGDGLPDVAYTTVATGGAQLSIQLNTGLGSSIAFASAVSQTVPGTTTCCSYGPGVGYTQMQLYGDNALADSTIQHMDFDGDGRQDLLLHYYVAYPPPGYSYRYLVPIMTRGTAAVVAGVPLTDATGFTGLPLAVRWNDDACTDIVFGVSMYLSECNGVTGASITLPTAATLSVDWDSDRRSDLLTVDATSGKWDLIHNPGYIGSPYIPAAVPTSIPATAGTWIVSDQNGDGLDDLVLASTASGYALAYGLHSGAYTLPDLAISFVDGYGNSASPTYVSIVQQVNYFPWSYQVFPYQNWIGPLYVAYSATFSDPSTASGTYSRDYWYAGAAMNLQGRGFAGFGSVEQLDSRSGIWDTRNYGQVFPNAGMLSYERQDLSNLSADSINLWTATLSSETLSSTANEERYFPYASNIVDNAYDVGAHLGVLVATTSTNVGAPDAYGNFDTVATTVTDEDSNSPYYGKTWITTTANTIAPQSGSTWCLNLPTQTVVTNSGTGVPASIARTVSYTPDYTHCRETQQVNEPSSTTYKVTTGYGFDSFGNVNSEVVTGVGMTARTTSLNWGTTGQFLTTVTNPLSQTTTFGYDPGSGMQTSRKDPNGIITSWLHDDFARKTQENRPDGTYTVWNYNDCATYGGCILGTHALALTHYVYNVGGSIQTNGTTYFDQVDRPLMANNLTLAAGTYNRNEVRYDSLGRMAQQFMPCIWVNDATPCPYWTTFLYDSLNRLTHTQRPVSASNSTPQTTMIAYAGRTTTSMDALGHSSIKITQVTGNLGRSQGPNGYYQNFNYDAFGSLLSVTDSASPANTLHSAVYAYGVAAFQTSSTDMDLGARSYTIDALGELKAYTDAKGQSFSTTYDALSRRLVRTEPDLTTTWTWGSTATLDNIGQLQAVSALGSNGTFSESYTYDSHGRPSTKIVSLPQDSTYTFTTTYNATTGLLDTLQYPTSTSSYQLKLQYGYANGILQSVADFNSPTTVFWTANTANARGQMTEETLGNNVVANRAYDAVTGWLSTTQAGVGGGSSLENKSFLFDYDGDVTQRQDNNQGLTEDFYYDTMNRLDHSTLGGTTNLQMTYDTLGMGNIAARSDVAAGATWTYDPVHKHAVTQAGSAAYVYSYDANGNQQIRNGITVGWTSYNYPNEISTTTEEVQFWYGAERQRWEEYYTSSAGTEVTLRPDKLLEKVINGSTLDYRHYIYAGSELVGIYSRTAAGTDTMRYVLADHQGSYADIVTDSTPGPVQDYVWESFTPFGNRRSGPTWSGSPSPSDENAINAMSRRGFTGETVLGVSMGLNHLNGRVEDAVTGRFLSPDPYIPDPGNTQSFNRYSYVNNNPLSEIDPTGFDNGTDCPDALPCQDLSPLFPVLPPIAPAPSDYVNPQELNSVTGTTYFANGDVYDGGVGLTTANGDFVPAGDIGNQSPSSSTTTGWLVKNPGPEVYTGLNPNGPPDDGSQGALSTPISEDTPVGGVQIAAPGYSFISNSQCDCGFDYAALGQQIAPYNPLKAGAAVLGIGIIGGLGGFVIAPHLPTIGYVAVDAGQLALQTLRNLSQQHMAMRLLANGLDAAYGEIAKDLSESEIISAAQEGDMQMLEKLSAVSQATELVAPEVTSAEVPW